MFNKHVPKNLINNVLNKINSFGRKRTRKNKRNKIYRGGVHESAMAMKLGEGLAAAAQSPGPLGMMYRFGSKVYGYGGGMMGTLVIGATLATILGSLKTMNIMTPDNEIDLVKQKKDDRLSCKGGITGANGLCLPKIVGTTPSRRIKRKSREDAVEAQRKREQTEAERDIVYPGLSNSGRMD